MVAEVLILGIEQVFNKFPEATQIGWLFCFTRSRGRVVYVTRLENVHTERYREFESLRLRQFERVL